MKPMQFNHQLLNIEDFGALYVAAQQSNLFSDSKFFVDAIPMYTVEEILQAYNQEKDKPHFNLLNFIKQHFSLPAESNQGYQSNKKPIAKHIYELWDVLTRQPDEAAGTLIPLPYPYIVPGGRFREIYYWDSYFTMLGLKEHNRWDIIENMIKNFAYLIEKFGHIPNGNHTYYLSRSQPPFFALMVKLLSEKNGLQSCIEYLPIIEKEYAFWMDGIETLNQPNSAYRRVVKLPDSYILNRYWDDSDTPRPEAYKEDTHLAKNFSEDNARLLYRNIRAAAESGWDFSSRWFANAYDIATIETTSIIPVDLNCILFSVENILAELYALTNQNDKAKTMAAKAEQRSKAIEHFCWNEKKNFYFDYHFMHQQQKDIYSLAAMYPLFIKITNKDKVENIIAVLTKHLFTTSGGALTTNIESGQQWDAPNGWAPLQWITYIALKNYSQNKLALQLKQNWMAQNENTYQQTGKLMEKYNVKNTNINAGGGEYPTQDGFGWTNGVYIAMLNDQLIF